MTTRLAVLGSPIAHSRSPALHRAAYGMLGLDWRYDAIEVGSGQFEGFIAGLGPEWRGLSLTMPLKREVMPLLTATDTKAGLAGAANTVLLSGGELSGFNTDVDGVVDAFRDAGVATLETVQIIGAGATAASVILAATVLGASEVTVLARNVEKAQSLAADAAAAGVQVTVRPLGVMDRSLIIPSAVVNTLPGDVEVDLPYPEAVRAQAVLFDIGYGHPERALTRSWRDADGTVIGGLQLLLFQAIRQVRIFTGGDPSVPLADEDRVVAAMRSAVGP